MNKKILLTRLLGLGTLASTTTGAILTSTLEERIDGIEGEDWDFVIRKSDQEIKGTPDLEWKKEPIVRVNSKGSLVTGYEIKILGKDNIVSWQCNIAGVMVGEPKSKNSRIDSQMEDLIARIKSDSEARRYFVDNCALNRLDEEREGWESGLDLEIVDVDDGYEIKDLNTIYQQELKGLQRLSKKQSILWSTPNSIYLEERAIGVLDIKERENGIVICRISGTPKISLKNLTFKDDLLKRVVEGNGERKRYLFRNCLEADRRIITGLEVVKVGSSNWKFSNIDKNLLSNIYRK